MLHLLLDPVQHLLHLPQLFILLKDQLLSLRVYGSERQRETSFGHVVAPLQQTAFPLLHDHPRHLVDALGPVVLVVRLLCHFLQVLHVGPHQHVPQQQEVRVERVLHLQMRPQMCVSGGGNNLACSLCGVIKLKTSSE